MKTAAASVGPRVEYNPSTLLQRFNASQTRAAKSPSEASKKFYEFMKKDYKQHQGEKMGLHLRAAVRRRDNTIDNATKVERLKSAMTGLEEMKRQNLNPSYNKKIGDTSFEHGSKEALGKGQFNEVFKCKFRQKEVGFFDKLFRRTPEAQEKAIKVAKEQLFNGAEVTIQKGVGIEAAKPRMTDRNVATSIVDQELGTKSVPKTSAGFLDGNPIVAMSIAPGKTVAAVLDEHPGIILDPEFQRQASNIEVIAHLCGNPDPHNKNIMVHVEMGADGLKNVKATMIDNDMSFGKRMLNPDQPPEFFGQSRTYRQTGLPAYMDAKTCATIKGMDGDKLAKKLAKNLDADELAAFKSRFKLLKAHVSFLEKNNRVVGDWGKFTNPKGKPLAGGDFIRGTLEMSGVQQGFRSGDKLVVPRSTIIRDYLESTPGLRAKLDAVLDSSVRDALASWKEANGTLVPPSGIDHGAVRRTASATTSDSTVAYDLISPRSDVGVATRHAETTDADGEEAYNNQNYNNNANDDGGVSTTVPTQDGDVAELARSAETAETAETAEVGDDFVATDDVAPEDDSVAPGARRGETEEYNLLPESDGTDVARGPDGGRERSGAVSHADQQSDVSMLSRAYILV